MEYLTSDMNVHVTGADVGSVWGNQFRWGNITFPSSPSYSRCTYANTVQHFVGML